MSAINNNKRKTANQRSEQKTKQQRPAASAQFERFHSFCEDSPLYSGADVTPLVPRVEDYFKNMGKMSLSWNSKGGMAFAGPADESAVVNQPDTGGAKAKPPPSKGFMNPNTTFPGVSGSIKKGTTFTLASGKVTFCRLGSMGGRDEKYNIPTNRFYPVSMSDAKYSANIVIDEDMNAWLQDSALTVAQSIVDNADDHPGIMPAVYSACLADATQMVTLRHNDCTRQLLKEKKPLSAEDAEFYANYDAEDMIRRQKIPGTKLSDEDQKIVDAYLLARPDGSPRVFLAQSLITNDALVNGALARVKTGVNSHPTYGLSLKMSTFCSSMLTKAEVFALNELKLAHGVRNTHANNISSAKKVAINREFYKDLPRDVLDVICGEVEIVDLLFTTRPRRYIALKFLDHTGKRMMQSEAKLADMTIAAVQVQLKVSNYDGNYYLKFEPRIVVVAPPECQYGGGGEAASFEDSVKSFLPADVFDDVGDISYEEAEECAQGPGAQSGDGEEELSTHGEPDSE
jgi:hypothetical protein